MSVVSGKTLIT